MSKHLDDTVPPDDTSLLDYGVAGLVVLLFGLLYWALNHGWGTQPLATAPERLPLLGTEFATYTHPPSPTLTPTLNNDVDTSALALPSVMAAAQPFATLPHTIIEPPTPASAQLAAAPSLVSTAALDIEALRVDMAQRQKAELDKLRTEMTAQQNAELEKARQAWAAQYQADLAHVQTTPATPATPAPITLPTLAANTPEQPIAPTLATTEIVSPQAETVAPPEVATSQPVELSIRPQSPPVDDTQPIPSDPATNTSSSNQLPLPDGTLITIDNTAFERQLREYMQENHANSPIIFDKVNFALGSAQLNPESKEQIKVVAALLNQYKDTNILIRGHTDNSGDLNTNSLLSLTRSHNMKSELATLGINDKRIRIEGVGPLKPIAPNDTEVGRASNRRIELIITDDLK